MDPATLAELPATAPSISSCTPAELLMHWIWCHLPLLSPEPPCTITCAEVPRTSQLMPPLCSSSTLYSCPG